MAFQKEKFPTVRLSDIDDLMRENALDSSDGQKLIDYIRRKQGAARPRLNLLLDGADNQINFRFDNLQPAPPPPPSSNEPAQTITDSTGAQAPATSRGPSVASPGIALVPPHSINSRIASFVTPMKGTSSPSLRNSPCKDNSPMINVARSPSRIPLQRNDRSGQLNRQTLIKECQRANQLKCEILRKMTSSTPNPGERTHRSDENFLSFKETISPITEDRSADGRPESQPRLGDAIRSRLDGTVPATQDQPGGVNRDVRETTPPSADEPLVVIPETPSPVRRSPTRPNTPFSALQSYRSPSMRKLIEQRRMSSNAQPHQRAIQSDDVDSTPQKSILKRRYTNWAPEQMVVSPSPGHRVSFCEQLNEVREVSPAYVRSPRSSDVTSDESIDENEEDNEVQQRWEKKQKDPSRRSGVKPDGVRNRKQSSSVARPNSHELLRKSQLTRTDAIDLPVESSQSVQTGDSSSKAEWDMVQRQMIVIQGLETPDSPSRKLRRRTLSFSELIANGVVDTGGTPRERDDSDMENPGAQIQQTGTQSAVDAGLPTTTSRESTKGGTQKAKNKTNGIAIDMITEDCGSDDSSDDSRPDERSSAVPPAAKTTQSSTISSPVDITDIATPRTVMMEIFEPPAAFCDDTTTGADSLPMEVDPPDGETSGDALHKRKRSVPRKHRTEVTEETEDVEQVAPMKVATLKHRIQSVSSPMDRVSSRMVDVVDMIHSQAGSVFDDPANDAEDAQRTTIVLPTKRARPKSTVDHATANYFKTVEQVCDPKKKLAKSKTVGRERRKLFARELSEAGPMCEENVPSPEPLPMTQDDEQLQNCNEEEEVVVNEKAVEMEEEEQDGRGGGQSKKPRKNRPAKKKATAIEPLKMRTAVVMLQRLSISTIERLENRNRLPKDNGGPFQQDNETETGVAPKSPIAKQQPPKGDDPGQRDNEMETDGAPESPIAEKQPTKGDDPRQRDNETETGGAPKSPIAKQQPPKGDDPGQRDNETETDGAPESPIAEKQNSEATEKTASAASAKSVAVAEANGQKRRRKNVQKKNPANQKYWKDVSNELRQHVEEEGLRRSNRNRCISAQALWCNPGTDKYDAPKYKMPTAKDILRLYQESEEAMRKAGKEKASKQKAYKEKGRANQGNAKGHSRKRPEEAVYDADGFRVPAVPAPVSSKAVAIQRDAGWSTSQESEDGPHSSANAASHDSGISSAVMTNDDVTETMPAPRKQQQPCSSGTAEPAPREGGSGGGSNGPAEDVLSAKRQAMGWMMMLMENQQEKHEGGTLMAVDIHGFTHCSIDHLTFQRRGDIEYSFYVYSKTDNFGFVRFLPNAVKKMARVTKCSLKFLIMRGSLTFAINGHEVQAVGGDFLMLSTGSSYKISNSSEVSLLFMIKTLIKPTD